MKLVWKAALVLSALCAIISAAVVLVAETWIEDGRTQKSIGIAACTFVMILGSALGGRWLRARRVLEESART